MAASMFLQNVMKNRHFLCIYSNSHISYGVMSKRYLRRRKTFGSPGSPSALPEIREEDDDFRTLVIPGYTNVETQIEKPLVKRERIFKPPRHIGMSTEQDWTSVWPTAKSFQWSAVPLPLRQGKVSGNADNDGISPGKYGNAELMKIPNFLHLTPAHIKKHCEALKPYCTKWPKALDRNDKIERLFPIEILRRTFVTDGASNQDYRSRLVTLQIKMASLELDYHARDKMKRLLGDRYNEKTGLITLSADRCPLKKQNYDYLHYVLTAVYFESCSVESWEEKELEDMEYFDWDQRQSRKNVVDTVKQAIKAKANAGESVPAIVQSLSDTQNEEEIVKHKSVERVRTSVEHLFNKGETQKRLMEYKQAVKDLLLSGRKPKTTGKSEVVEENVSGLNESGAMPAGQS